MSRNFHLKRRPSGIYVVRLVVPERLRIAVGQAEVHRSTGCRDLALAKVVAAEVAANWHGRIADLRKMDLQKLKAGSVRLLGDGHLPLLDAAADLGAEPADLVARLRARGSHFWVRADGWDGWALDDLFDLEREVDPTTGETTAFTTSLEAVARVGTRCRLSDQLRIAMATEVDDIARSGAPRGICLFFRRGQRGPAFVVEFPGVQIGLPDLLVRRSDVEALRSQLAAGLATIGEEARAASVTLPHSADSIAKAKHAAKPVSELTAHYLGHRSARWRDDERNRQRQACEALIELTGDMQLGEIDRDVIRELAAQLARVPARRDIVRRKFGVSEVGLKPLIAVADREGLPRLTPGAVERLLEDIQSIFDWGVTQTWLRENPAKKLSTEVFVQLGGKRKLEHEKRDPFSQEDLNRIFAAEWFVRGVGSKTAKGDYFHYRPHYYWLPLLGRFTGGRINELSQLYLSDIRSADGLGWYLDFNLDRPDKVNADEGDPTASLRTSGHDSPNGDKSLKTVNAKRVVPLHARLIDLGFIDYVEALEGAGYKRLFPELKHDAIKGYGKAAGKWFNDRFLGRSLSIERNGRKVFHSFRHNFDTELERAGAPDKAIRQLMGHALVDDRLSATAPGYSHPRVLDELMPVIKLLNPVLPAIAKFNVQEGLIAVEHALRLKKSHGPRDAR